MKLWALSSILSATPLCRASTCALTQHPIPNTDLTKVMQAHAAATADIGYATLQVSGWEIDRAGLTSTRPCWESRSSTQTCFSQQVLPLAAKPWAGRCSCLLCFTDFNCRCMRLIQFRCRDATVASACPAAAARNEQGTPLNTQGGSPGSGGRTP